MNDPALVTSPDALPLSCRRLVGARATRLGSCDKHPVAYCYDWKVDVYLCMRNDRNVMVNFKPAEYMRKILFSQ